MQNHHDNIPNRQTVDKQIQKKIDGFLKEISQFFDKERIETIAKETGFTQKCSELTGHLFLSIFVFGVNLYKDPTLEQLVSLLEQTLAAVQISCPGLHERITHHAVAFFDRMLSLALRLKLPRGLALPVANQFRRLLIWDSTEFELPAGLARVFPGKGGSAAVAGVKIQFCYDLKASEWFYLVTGATQPDSTMTAVIAEQTQATDLVLCDLGYFNVATFAAIDRRGGYYLSRLKSDAGVYQATPAGAIVPVDLLALIKRGGFERTSRRILLHSKYGEYTPCRLIIERVPPAVVNRCRRKLHQLAHSRGKTPSARALLFATVNVFITNAPAELLADEQCQKLYALRWQIELVFKAWKSNLGLAHIRSERPARVRCTILARLIFITISAKVVHLATVAAWRTCQREVSYFRALKLLLPDCQTWWNLALANDASAIVALLSKKLATIQRRCLKRLQHGRIYPLQLLDKL